uniref:Rap-GAP domain-containing protein n=1 Tax=Plectus sambesii TaxID=2011161 RepID=A0A914XFS6_9BILA
MSRRRCNRLLGFLRCQVRHFLRLKVRETAYSEYAVRRHPPRPRLPRQAPQVGPRITRRENLCALFDNFTSLPGADRGKITAKLLSVYELILNRIETIDYNLVGQLLTDLVELGLRQTGDAAGSGSVLPLLLKTVDRCSGRAVDERKSHLIAIVRSVFAHLVQFYAQFPLPQFNVAQLNCVEWAEDTKRRASTQSTADIVDGRVLVGLNREGMLWSVGVAGGEFSLTTRSIAGKHCWSVGEVATAKPKSEAEKNGLNEWLVRVSGKLHSRRVERERSQSGIFGAIAEPLTELCEHIAQSSPECLPHAQFPDPRAEPFLPCEADVKAAVHQSAAKSLTYEPASTSAIPNSPINSWHQWRSLLADLDVPQWSKRNSIDRVAADKTHMLRSLRHLDQLVVRDVHKFAVIYVADGQEEKTAILANKIGSIQFEDFVARLGWTVDMKEHAGYSGGLPADCQTPYYATLRTEAIFHVSTRLPDDATKKLRHIGNDEVHIVWSEHWRDYRRNTIATKFCDVLIVVYPLPSRLFRVSIETTKPLVFGPLFDGALVDWVSLPALIRVTAINASRAYRRLQPQWTAPSQHRAEVVNQTLGELRKPSLYSGLVSHLYSPDNSLLHDIIPTTEDEGEEGSAEYTKEVPWYQRVPEKPSSSSSIPSTSSSSILDKKPTADRKQLVGIVALDYRPPTAVGQIVTPSDLKVAKRKRRKEKKKRKKEKKSSKKRRRHRSRSPSPSSSSSSSSESDAEQPKADLAQLRAERLRREANERAKADAVIRKARGLPEPPPVAETKPVYKQRYNSQFNPEMAKQNRVD